MQKVGRYTAGILILAIGAALLFGEAANEDYLDLLLHYWPVFLIALGIEYLIFNGVASAKNQKLRLDVGSLLLSVLISFVVVTVVQGTSVFGLQTDWFGNWGQDRERIAKQPVMLEWDDSVQNIRVVNPNGDVTVMADDTIAPQIQATVGVATDDPDEARQIADESEVHVEWGETLTIRAEGKEYRKWWVMNKARMDLVIILPEQTFERLETDLMNGDITVKDIRLAERGDMRTKNGDIRLVRVEATDGLKAETLNGDVVAERLNGPAVLISKNGDIQVKGSQSGVDVSTLNGEIRLQDIAGDAKADTKNGDIDLTNIGRTVDAKTLNGDIRAGSPAVGGNWTLDTTTGDITLKLPRSGDYEMDGNTDFGKASTNLDLQVENKRITGQIGKGTYSIDADSGGDLKVEAID